MIHFILGTKDLPKIARTAGRLAGRAIGYVQLARGQFETVMQQSQASKVLLSTSFREPSFLYTTSYMPTGFVLSDEKKGIKISGF